VNEIFPWFYEHCLSISLLMLADSIDISTPRLVNGSCDFSLNFGLHVIKNNKTFKIVKNVIFNTTFIFFISLTNAPKTYLPITL